MLIDKANIKLNVEHLPISSGHKGSSHKKMLEHDEREKLNCASRFRNIGAFSGDWIIYIPLICRTDGRTVN